jgi:HD-GYP domain-containing protein (c-di-GMP phosphodiesterase class II)
VSEARHSAKLTAVERLIVQIVAAINTRTLYVAAHPNVAKAVERLIDALVAACEERRQDAITFLAIDGEVVVDQRPLRRSGLYQEQFVRLLTRRGIERLTLARGLDAAECLALLEPLSLSGVPGCSPHVVVGRVEVRALDGEAGHAPAPLSNAALDGAREAFTAFRRDMRGGLRRLEEVVGGLIDALSRATREALPLAPLKDHDEYTFVHSVNVALLTLQQARSFGFDSGRLHTIGMAAMLHDLGKLKIPLEVLNKPGKLEGDEWRVMQSHPEVGARNLCGIEGSHPLSIVVAYEHHLRFDGRPAYPRLSTPRAPTLPSQLTSIADAYDAICTTRPYQVAQSRLAAVEILRRRAGTFYDPLLVGNFARILGVPPAEGEAQPG